MTFKRLAKRYAVSQTSAQPVAHPVSDKRPGGMRPVISKVLLVITVFMLVVGVPLVFASGVNISEDAKIAEQDSRYAPVGASGADGVVLPENLLKSTATSANTYSTDPYQETAQETETVSEMQVTGTETAMPSEFVLGTQHAYVAEIQQRLMDLNYMEADEPTTLFGPMTSQAIQYFQRKNGLPMTGVANAQTLSLLFSDEAKSYMVSEGESGADVESLQQRLADLGYSVSVTGYFGTETAAAVKAFQRNNGLTVDGKVGAQTKEKIYSSSAVGNNNSSGSGSGSSGGSSGSSGSGSGSSGGSSGTPPTANASKVEAFIAVAESLVGKPYVLGGKGPDTFDCSGFVYYALKESGNGIGYMTSYGWASSGYATITRMSDLRRGDIVCFSNNGSGTGGGHVGIYLGGDDMIDASSTQGKIRYSYGISGSSYWTRNFICGKRPLT